MAQAKSCVSWPRRRARGCGTREAAARLHHRAAHGGQRLLQAHEARRLAAPQQRGQRKQQREHDHRDDRREDERVLAALEQADGGEHDRPEHGQGDDVQQASVRRACRARPAIARARARAGARRSARATARPGGRAAWRTSAPRSSPRGRRRAGARASGSAARRIACQASARTQHRQAHQRERDQHPDRRRGDERVDDRLDPDPLERQRGEADAGDGAADHGALAGDAARRGARSVRGRRARSTGSGARRTTGRPSAGTRPSARAGRRTRGARAPGISIASS